MILKSKDLAHAMLRTTRSVKLLDADNKPLGKVSPDQAGVLLARGGYEAGGSVCRVKYLREKQRDERLFVVAPGFWDGRGCIRFWNDSRRGVGKVA